MRIEKKELSNRDKAAIYIGFIGGAFFGVMVMVMYYLVFMVAGRG